MASGAYRVATGTITVVKEGSGFLINRIGGTVLWALGEGIDLFGDGTSLKLAFSNGYEAIGPNGIKIQGEVLMEDANQALVKMKQAGSEG